MVVKKSNNDVRPNYLGKVILAFILASIVFVLIFILGYTISYNKYQAVAQSQESLRYTLLSFDIEREIIGDSCENFNVYRFTEELDNMGRVISILETRLGKNNPQVLNQKKTYVLLEARHLLYVSDYNKNCNNSFPVVLFFYSNNEGDKDRADRLGYMLSSLKGKNSNVLIYSFDFNLDSSLVVLLKDKYNITASNQLVINDKTYHESFTNVDELVTILG